MTYHAKYTGPGDDWEIVDEEGREVFRGTKRQCEDWLDWKQNRRRSGMRKNSETKAIAFLVVAFLGVTLAVSGAYQYGTKATVTLTVKNKERINGGESSYYLIYGHGETYKNSDALFHGKFDSSDIYGRLEPGQRYRANVYGWRIPFLSMYRNIIDAEPLLD